MNSHYEHAPRSENHLMVAGLAAVLSLLLHGALALFVSRLDVVPGATRTQARMAEQRHEAFLMRESQELSAGAEEKLLEELRRSGVAGDQPLDDQVAELVPLPDTAVTEPPAATQEGLAAQESSVLEPGALPSRDAWTPRQEILVIEDLAVADDVRGFERRMIPIVERVQEATPIGGGPAELSAEMVASLTAPVDSGVARTSPPPLLIPDAPPPVPGGPGIDLPPDPILDEVIPEDDGELFQEKPEVITEVTPIERMLTYRIETYRGFRDFSYGYFRLEIDRAGEQVLPRMPKDIILVQDASASLAEQRLYFCREGLAQSLALIGPEDRFNVASFNESLTTCFPDWVAPTDATRARAASFIGAMRSSGNTDIYNSLRALLTLPRAPGRPVIAVVITDGLANKGYTSSSRIISYFSRENAGLISVFTIGTFKQANTYLVDLLSYCNRGEVSIVESGRWDIPDAIASVVRGTARPVLGNLRLALPSGSACELYPGQPANLFLDRPLVLYGRYPKDQERLVIQVLGETGDQTCDTMFDIELTEEIKGRDKAIKDTWARQKIYHLMGEHARTGDPDALDALRDTSRSYRQDIPYEEALLP